MVKVCTDEVQLTSILLAHKPDGTTKTAVAAVVEQKALHDDLTLMRCASPAGCVAAIAV